MGNLGNGQRLNNTGGFRNNAGATQKSVEIIEIGNTVLRCYNYNGKGHLANACPKPRTRGSAFHKQALICISLKLETHK